MKKLIGILRIIGIVSFLITLVLMAIDINLNQLLSIFYTRLQ
jgi:hypothetical protein